MLNQTVKRQVRRNIERFPKAFIFQLNTVEFKNWRSQFGTSNATDKRDYAMPLLFLQNKV